MAEAGLRLLIFGAHPDDAEFHAGGLSTIYRQAGHHVRMISVTNGGAGHHRRTAEELVPIRRQEAERSAAVIGATCQVWDSPDGALLPTLELREKIIRTIRSFQPDLVLTHRPYDYHPDHRAVGQAVQDASYLVTVPLVATDTPALRRDPVVAYMPDLFTRPCPFRPDIIVDISTVLDTMIDMLACHESQVFEFLPYSFRHAIAVPDDRQLRKAWLRDWYGAAISPRADVFRKAIEQQYGPTEAERIQAVEAFEISEYAAPLDRAARDRLFWFLAKR